MIWLFLTSAIAVGCTTARLVLFYVERFYGARDVREAFNQLRAGRG